MKLVATDTKVKIQWFVWAGNEKIAYESSMRGTWGFDAKCSCGWETRTGGAVRSSVQSDVNTHKFSEHGYRYEIAGI